MSIDSVILIICIVVAFLLGLLVFLQNRKQPNNVRFALLSIALILWITFNYISDNSDSHVLLSTRLTFISGILTIYAFVNFLLHFPKNVLVKFKLSINTFNLIALFMLPVALTPWFIEAVSINESHAEITTGSLYNAFNLYVFVALLLIVSSIKEQYSSAESLAQKNQIRLVSIGALLYAFFAIGSNVVLPFIIDNWSVSRFGPAFTLFFQTMVAYAIIKHKLFDIKALVARSFVYTITTTVLVTLYSAISLPVKNFLISINTESYISTIVEIVLLGIFGVSFYPLKVYFDRVTTKYFFRDHYNTQEVLRSINAILSDSVDLDRMLHRVGGILRSTLHVEYCSFMIDENDGETSSTRHINIGRAIHRVTIPEDLEKLLKKSNVVVTEQLRDDDEFEKDQKQQLIRQDIAGVVKLKGVDEHGHIENEGFLILGNKKSGRGFSGQDEKMLEILSGQFAVAIQNLVHLDEIVHFNIKLQEEVTDATKELKVKNKKLRELDQTKDEFVSMASHQLRTPLTSVKGYLSMVLDGDAGELKPAQKQLLDQAYISTQRMVYLIADLLNLSRLKTGKFMINPQPTNLAHMIEGEIHQIEQTARASDLKVSFMCDPSIPDLMLDDMKTRQVIMNFIDNAIYYTPKGGSIEVYLEKEDGKAIFKVSDSGIGVAKEDQKELFGKFFRAGNARKARPDGTGLGLYMAKMVIDAQGGKILFSSQEGKGSTFGFSFDIKQLQVRPDTQNLPVTPEKTS